tara:strand:+ start:284 stop:679 length:396 start_codon:yes stop_codon:yes gene_type:complete
MMVNTKNQGRRLYLRSCDYCNKGISVGYVWGGSNYGCDDCYITHIIEWTISLMDNQFFLEADDKENFIYEVSDQLYYGWTEEDDDGDLYYDYKGNRVYDLNPLDEIVYGQEVYDLKTLNYNWVEQIKGVTI